MTVSLFDEIEEKPVVKLVPTRIRFALEEPRCVLRLLGVTPDRRERTWNDVRRKQAVKKFSTQERQSMTTANTTTAPKTTTPAMPPPDVGGETESALALLNKLRNAYNKSDLSAEWKRWVFDSFVKGVNATPKPLIPEETAATSEKKA